MSVLITGASAGIGRELAIVFAEHGYDVIAVGRDLDRLRALERELAERCGARTELVQKDLLQPDAPEDLVREIASRGLTPDILVNNAGSLEIGAFHRIPLDRTLAMLQLNVFALTALTRLCLPGMLERRSGRILNMASISAFVPAPSLAVYGATKAFILSLSEALVEELAGTGVGVTVVCPGGTETAMLDKVRGSSAQAESFYTLLPPSDPRDVAQQAYDACMRCVPVHTPGNVNQAVEYLVRWPPRWVVRTMVGAFGRQFL